MFDGFGEVRSVLHGARTPKTWDRLCVLLDGMSGAHLRTRVLPYVLESLLGWADSLRVAPRRWVDRLVYSGRCDLITLTKRLSFAPRVRLDTLKILLASQSMRGVSFVEFGSRVASLEALEMLLASPAVARGALRGLGFGPVSLGADELGLLLDSGVPWTELAFSDMNMSERVLELAQHSNAESLERLRLARCQLDERAAAALATSSRFSRLEEMSVEGNCIGWFVSRFVRTAAYTGAFPRLHTLDLSATNLQADDTAALLSLLERSPISSLDLSSVPAADAFVREVPGSPSFKDLRRLNVTGSLSDLDPLAWLIDAPGVSDALRAHALSQLCAMSRPSWRTPESIPNQFELPW